MPRFSLAKGCYYITERHQRLINQDAFLERFTCRPRLRAPLRTGEIDEIQLSSLDKLLAVPLLSRFEVDLEDGVAAGRACVHLCRRRLPIVIAEIHCFLHLFD